MMANDFNDEDDFRSEPKPKSRLARLPDDVKPVFKEYDQKFDNSIYRLRQKYPLRKDFERELLECGAKLDKEMWDYHGLAKKDYGRRSFRVRAWLYTKKIKSDSSLVAMMVNKTELGGVASENLTAELLYGPDKQFEFFGDLLISMNGKRLITADTWDAVDVLAHKITQMWMEDLNQAGLVPCREEFDSRELQFLLTQTEKQFFIVVSFEEHKRLLGKSTWSRKQVEKHVISLQKLDYSGDLSFITKDHGRVSFWVGGSFADIFIPKDEGSWDWIRDSPQFKHQASKLESGGGYIVNFTGHTWGMLFFLNVLNRHIQMLPRRFYTRLQASARLLFRLTLPKAQGTVNLAQVVKVQGLKPEVTPDGLRKRLNEIQADWRSLVEEGFIKKVPEQVKEKGLLTWHYERVPNWFNEPKTLLP